MTTIKEWAPTLGVVGASAAFAFALPHTDKAGFIALVSVYVFAVCAGMVWLNRR